jgi:hypothetical protein
VRALLDPHDGARLEKAGELRVDEVVVLGADVVGEEGGRGLLQEGDAEALQEPALHRRRDMQVAQPKGRMLGP